MAFGLRFTCCCCPRVADKRPTQVTSVIVTFELSLLTELDEYVHFTYLT